ncbi:MAG: response regulator [Opitutaceae bacterium]|nr:response regulator [Cytophagales bacterium]
MTGISILLVEDNEGDIILTLEALKENKIANTIRVVRDGLQAMKFLNKEGQYIAESTPDLILLDINLPKVDGKEVLSFIKNHEDYKSIPVVMLTTSTSEKDILDSYKAYANCYIAKPVDLGKFMDVVKSIENFWVTIVQLPINR